MVCLDLQLITLSSQNKLFSQNPFSFLTFNSAFTTNKIKTVWRNYTTFLSHSTELKCVYSHEWMQNENWASVGNQWKSICCYISALVLNCFRLKKGRATLFRPEKIVASFLHSMVLLPKMPFNHFWKHQFVVLHCHIYN